MRDPAGRPSADPQSLDQRLDVIARHPFRARFHLRGRDRARAGLQGMSIMRLHARDLIARRLAPAEGVDPGSSWRRQLRP